MQIVPYLNFSGECETAFRFYEKLLGGKVVAMMNHGDSPMRDQVPPAWHSKIMHALLQIGDQTLMGSDAPPEYFERPQGFSVSLTVEDEFEAERIFQGLSEGARRIKMPLGPTFWAARFGMLIDRFGIPWIISGGNKPL